MRRNGTGAFLKFRPKAIRVTRVGNVLTGFDKTGRKTWSFHEFSIPGTGGFIAGASVNFLTARAIEKVDISSCINST
jgi:hypothetical protein